MNDNPPFKSVAMAMDAAAQSDCANSRRGAAVVAEGRVVSVGWNHLPTGACSPACPDAKCGRRALHAEQHAILAANRMLLKGASVVHVRREREILATSGNPRCEACAALMLHHNMAGIWLFHADGWKFYTAEENYRRAVKARCDEAAAKRDDADMAMSTLDNLAKYVGLGQAFPSNLHEIERAVIDRIEGRRSAGDSTPPMGLEDHEGEDEWDDFDDDEGPDFDDDLGDDDPFSSVCIGNKCIMVGDHLRAECHTVEMYEAYLEESNEHD